MPRLKPEVVVFRDDDVTGMVGLMAELAPRAGWLVLQPGVDEDELPDGRAADKLLTKRPPLAPICTWIPGERTRSGIEHVAMGIEHARGKGALEGVPDGWEVMQDSAKNGLIVAAPPAIPHGDVLVWLLGTGAMLARLPLTGEWRALAYRR